MFKDILVHLDASPQSDARLATAATLCAAFDGHLTGLYVIPPDPVPMLYAAGGPASAGAVLASDTVAAPNAFREHRERAAHTFEAACEVAGVHGSWCEREGPVASIVSTYARFADLVVLGQDPEEPGAGHAPAGLAADAALRSGRPILVVPCAGDWQTFGRHVLVAWTASREAARAVHDALPLLKEAQEVTVVTVAESPLTGDEDLLPGLDITEHLLRHGINASWHRGPSDLGIASELLSRVAEHRCDLLVMGAYGHSRLREFVFGGATRQILAHMTAPVLLSN